MMNSIFLAWGLLPLFAGMGFIFKPRLMVKLNKGYSKRMQRFQKRLFKAHRTTGLALLLAGTVILATVFYPEWIFNCFLIARVVYLAFFPQHGIVIPSGAVIVPTVWI